MDYTNLPKKEVYKDRGSIEEFDIYTDGSIEKLMFDKFCASDIIDLEGMDKYVLEIFNTARYITTMILAEKNPILYFGKFVNITLKIGAAPGYQQNTYGRYFSAFAWAMIVNYLKICDEKYCDKDEILTSKIWKYHVVHFNDLEVDGDARFMFFNNVQYNQVIETARQFVNKDDFQPLCEVNTPQISLASEEDVVAIVTNYKAPEDSVPSKKQTDNDSAQLHARIEELEALLKKEKDKNYQLNVDNTKLYNENQKLKESQIESEGVSKLRQENERLKKHRENILVGMLKPAFYSNEKDAREFLLKILDKGLDNVSVTDIARQYYIEKKITKSKKGRYLWTIMVAAQLYDASEQNWGAAVKSKDDD